MNFNICGPTNAGSGASSRCRGSSRPDKDGQERRSLSLPRTSRRIADRCNMSASHSVGSGRMAVLVDGRGRRRPPFGS